MKSPISGTLTSTREDVLGCAEAVGTFARGAVVGADGADGVGALDVATEADDELVDWAVEVFCSPDVSSINKTLPSCTLSPSLTLSSRTIPFDEQGISIDALSDSTVIKDCSCLTESPGLTNSSITETSAKSPISGTFISIKAI